MSLYPLHPVANLFPEMSPEDFDALKADIAAHGLLSPIWLNTRGELLDGRHRVRALQELGRPVPPDKIDTYRGDEPELFAVSQNAKRRHLTASQLSMVAGEAKKLRSERIAATQHASRVERGKQGGRGKKKAEVEKLIPNVGKQLSSDATRETAAAFGISHSYVSAGERIIDETPDLVPHVKAGRLTLPEATRIARATSEDTAEVRAAVTARALQLNDTRRAVREHLRAKRPSVDGRRCEICDGEK